MTDQPKKSPVLIVVIVVIAMGAAIGAFFIFAPVIGHPGANQAVNTNTVNTNREEVSDPNTIATTITDSSGKIIEILDNTETTSNNNQNTNSGMLNSNTSIETNSAEQQRYQDLQEEHQQYNTDLTDNLNAGAVAVMSSEWTESKQYSQNAIDIFQQWIKIDENLIELASQLGLESDAAKFAKRIDWSEASIEFYEKSIECADYKITEDEKSYTICDTEIAEIYDRVYVLLEEWSALEYADE